MSAEWIEADADEGAVRQAHAMLEGTPRFELWESKRLIARDADRPR